MSLKQLLERLVAGVLVASYGSKSLLFKVLTSHTAKSKSIIIVVKKKKVFHKPGDIVVLALGRLHAACRRKKYEGTRIASHIRQALAIILRMHISLCMFCGSLINSIYKIGTQSSSICRSIPPSFLGHAHDMSHVVPQGASSFDQSVN